MPITKKDIRELMDSERKAIDILTEKGKELKDCTYEIGIFMKQTNITFLEEVYSGEVRLTKSSIDDMIEKLEGDKEQIEGIHRTGPLLFTARLELLKRLKQEYFTEVIPRMTKRKKLIVLNEQLTDIDKRISDLHVCDTSFCMRGVKKPCAECQSVNNVLMKDFEFLNELLDERKKIITDIDLLSG